MGKSDCLANVGGDEVHRGKGKLTGQLEDRQVRRNLPRIPNRRLLFVGAHRHPGLGRRLAGRRWDRVCPLGSCLFCSEARVAVCWTSKNMTRHCRWPQWHCDLVFAP